MNNVLNELNKSHKEYVVMTKDRKCILRGTAGTHYELALTTEKSKKKIRICCSTASLGLNIFTKCTDGVVKLYNLESNKITNDLIKSLEFVRVYKTYKF